MDNIAVTKPDMGVLSRGRLNLSPFGALSQALAQEILARTGQEEGVYPYVPMDLLEEGEEPQDRPAPVQSANANIQVELKLVLEALDRAGKEEKERIETVQRILERAVRVREQFSVPVKGQTAARPAAQATKSGPVQKSESVYPSQQSAMGSSVPGAPAGVARPAAQAAKSGPAQKPESVSPSQKSVPGASAPQALTEPARPATKAAKSGPTHKQESISTSQKFVSELSIPEVRTEPTYPTAPAEKGGSAPRGKDESATLPQWEEPAAQTAPGALEAGGVSAAIQRGGDLQQNFYHNFYQTIHQHIRFSAVLPSSRAALTGETGAGAASAERYFQSAAGGARELPVQGGETAQMAGFPQAEVYLDADAMPEAGNRPVTAAPGTLARQAGLFVRRLQLLREEGRPFSKPVQESSTPGGSAELQTESAHAPVSSQLETGALPTEANAPWRAGEAGETLPLQGGAAPRVQGTETAPAASGEAGGGDISLRIGVNPQVEARSIPATEAKEAAGPFAAPQGGAERPAETAIPSTIPGPAAPVQAELLHPLEAAAPGAAPVQDQAFLETAQRAAGQAARQLERELTSQIENHLSEPRPQRGRAAGSTHTPRTEGPEDAASAVQGPVPAPGRPQQEGENPVSLSGAPAWSAESEKGSAAPSALPREGRAAGPETVETPGERESSPTPTGRTWPRPDGLIPAEARAGALEPSLSQPGGISQTEQAVLQAAAIPGEELILRTESRETEAPLQAGRPAFPPAKAAGSKPVKPAAGQSRENQAPAPEFPAGKGQKPLSTPRVSAPESRETARTAEKSAPESRETVRAAEKGAPESRETVRAAEKGPSESQEAAQALKAPVSVGRKASPVQASPSVPGMARAEGPAALSPTAREIRIAAGLETTAGQGPIPGAPGPVPGQAGELTPAERAALTAAAAGEELVFYTGQPEDGTAPAGVERGPAAQSAGKPAGDAKRAARRTEKARQDLETGPSASRTGSTGKGSGRGARTAGPAAESAAQGPETALQAPQINVLSSAARDIRVTAGTSAPARTPGAQSLTGQLLTTAKRGAFQQIPSAPERTAGGETGASVPHAELVPRGTSPAAETGRSGAALAEVRQIAAGPEPMELTYGQAAGPMTPPPPESAGQSAGQTARPADRQTVHVPDWAQRFFEENSEDLTGGSGDPTAIGVARNISSQAGQVDMTAAGQLLGGQMAAEVPLIGLPPVGQQVAAAQAAGQAVPSQPSPDQPALSPLQQVQGGFRSASAYAVPLQGPAQAAGQRMVEWTAPGWQPPMVPTQLRERQQADQSAVVQPQTVRISDAEIRRTADQVYKIIEDRIRRERRRLGL